VELEDTSTAGQWLGKHFTGATNRQATIEELLETLFSIGSAPRLYNDDLSPAEGITEKKWRCS
jgi:hypothetical protein